MKSNELLLLLCLSVSLACCLRASEELLIADFEGPDYGAWKSTGEAFGGGPAQGALPGQMPVDGYLGKGLVNGFTGGDDATGTLTSPPFRIDRKFINFLIGGGGFMGETCINLVSDGKVVRTATGPNQSPGGSERLGWESWEVTDLAGKTVSLEIVDARKGGWGHINVDQIVQSDTAKVLAIQKQFAVNQRYLIWPVSTDKALKKRFFMSVDGEEAPFAFYDICLTGTPDFWVFTDLTNYMGKAVIVTCKLPGDMLDAWNKVAISGTYPGEKEIYQEPLRPQYHFTSRRGWLNDPNGLVWKDGTWHLFYQHNPYNHGWDNMTWGHAVSPDLYHWEERPAALFPDAEGTMYSGSAVIAPKEHAGVSIQGENGLVLAYTANGRLSYLPGHEADQGIAFSNDNGMTFQKFAGNPVIPHIRGENRDPKVFWHGTSRHWVMNLYLDGNDYAIFTSPDLVKWEKSCDYRIPGESECPDMFELPVDGETGNTRWVVWGANGIYMLGSFDGRVFTPEGGTQRHYFGSAYAGQSYDNAPDGRRVHIGWMRAGESELRGAPFNCQMTVPMDFTLRNSGDGVRLWAEPSPEITGLRESTREWKDLDVNPGDIDPLAGFKAGQFEIEAVMDAGSEAAEMGFQIFDQAPVVWKKTDQTFSGAEGKQAPVDGKIHLRIFVDTVSMEVFVNGTYTSRYLLQTPGTSPLKIISKGGGIHFDSLKVHTLRSVWK